MFANGDAFQQALPITRPLCNFGYDVYFMILIVYKLMTGSLFCMLRADRLVFMPMSFYVRMNGCNKFDRTVKCTIQYLLYLRTEYPPDANPYKN